MSATATPDTGRDQRRGRVEWDVWVRRGCALVVATVAAYEHHALRGGADVTSSALWPLSVDGLLVLATVGLLTSSRWASRRVRFAIWAAFGLVIAVSLVTNIAAAPRLAWQPVLVAGWPPVALLLAVELLAHRSRDRERIGPAHASTETGASDGSTAETSETMTPAPVPIDARRSEARTAEEVMWEYFQCERSRGRFPNGAKLDRVDGTRD